MTDIPTGDIDIDNIAVRRVSAPRTNQPPIVVRYAGAVADVLQGPKKNTWGPRELVLIDRYDLHRVAGRLHDAVAIEQSGIRPTDIKTAKPHHGSQRRRNGCLILRENQHRALKNVPNTIQRDHGFVADGDYVGAIYESIKDMIILLDDARISARDLDRMVDPSFYSHDGRDEASVEWTELPQFSPEEMYARLDAADTYLRALGEDPATYADDLARVRDCVAQVEADQVDQNKQATETP